MHKISSRESAATSVAVACLWLTAIGRVYPIPAATARLTPPPRFEPGDPLNGATIMAEFGELDGTFHFFAVVTPDGRIPTVGEDSTLNDPAVWYTGPIGTIAHLSDFALVFTDHDDARDEMQIHAPNLPDGTKILAFSVVVEEIDNHFDAS